jgi:hypothetical protein
MLQGTRLFSFANFQQPSIRFGQKKGPDQKSPDGGLEPDEIAGIQQLVQDMLERIPQKRHEMAFHRLPAGNAPMTLTQLAAMPEKQVQARLYQALSNQLSLFDNPSLPNHQLLRAAWLRQQYMDFVTHSPATPFSASLTDWSHGLEAGRAAFRTRLREAFDIPPKNASALEAVLFETKIPAALGFKDKAAMDRSLTKAEKAFWHQMQSEDGPADKALDIIKQNHLTRLKLEVVRNKFAEILGHTGPTTPEAVRQTMLARYEAEYAKVAERVTAAKALEPPQSLEALGRARAPVYAALIKPLVDAFDAEGLSQESTLVAVKLPRALGYKDYMEMNAALYAISERLEAPFINMSAE